MDIISIGDGMITFNPHSKGPLRFVNQFERKIGGAELNLLIGCARLGLQTGWISRLGKDEFGRHILNMVRGEGIDISEVKLVEGYPTSLNFKEVQESGNGKTFYYRQKSPTETLTPDLLPLSYIQKAKILHITGVFPAITSKNREVILRALEIAKSNNVKVSLDPNIRLRLWCEKDARETLLLYLPFVDYLLAGKEELQLLFQTTDLKAMIPLLNTYQFEHVIIKDGVEGSYALIADEWFHQPSHGVNKVVDTVGAGDGFDAGFLYGVLNNWPIGRILEFANAIGAMVVQVNGDNEGLPYLEEVDAFLGLKTVIER